MKPTKFFALLSLLLAGFAFSQQEVPLFSLSSSSTVGEDGTQGVIFTITQQEENGIPAPDQGSCTSGLDWAQLSSCIVQITSVGIGSASSSAVELGSDLNLGGITEGKESCVYDLAPLDFGGMIWNFDGKGHQINGFCYMVRDDNQENEVHAGFFADAWAAPLHVKNVTFNEAYINVKVDVPTAYAGVVVSRAGSDFSLDSVKIESSQVVADPYNEQGDNLATNFYLGGVAGFWDVQDQGMHNLEVSVKNSNVGNSKEGAMAYLGGAFGSLNYETSVTLSGSLENITVKGGSYAGGVVGYAQGSTTMGELLIRDVEINGKVENGASKQSSAGGLIGLVENATALDISRNSVSMTVQDTGKGMVNVGGLLGTVQNLKWAAVKGNSVVGLISAPVEDASVGYLIGATSPENFTPEVYSNFYYAANDGDGKGLAVLGIGSMTEEDWLKGSYGIFDNFRNATEVVSASGTFELNSLGPFKNGDDYWKNGVVDGSLMTTSAFVAQLNTYEAYWGVDENGLYPVLAKNGAAPIYIVTLDFFDIYGALKDSDLKILRDLGLKESFDADGELLQAELKLFTGNDGKLPAATLSALSKLSNDIFFMDYGRKVNLDGVFENHAQAFARKVKAYNVAYLYREMEADEYDNFPEENLFDQSSVRFSDWADYTPIFLRSNVKKFSTDQMDLLIPWVVAAPKDGGGVELLKFARACVVGVDKYQGNESGPLCYSGTEIEISRDASFNVLSSWLDQVVPDKDSVYFVYRKAKQEDFMYASLENVVENNFYAPLVVKDVGETMDGKSVVAESIELDDYQGFVRQGVLYGANFVPEMPVGYKMNSWMATIQLMDGTSADPIEVNRNDLGTVDELTAAIKAAVPENGYVPDIQWQVTLDAGDTLKLQNMLNAAALAGATTYGSFTLNSKISIKPDYDFVRYKIDFNLGDVPKDVFLYGNFDEFSLDYNAREFPMLFSTEACFTGWRISPEELDGAAEFLDDYILNNVEIEDNVFSLYGDWWPLGGDNCPDIQTAEIVLETEGVENKEYEISLWQSFERPSGEEEKFSHPFVNGRLTMPQAYVNMDFHVSVNPPEGFALSGLKLQLVEPTAGEIFNEIPAEISSDDILLTVPSEEGVSYKLLATFGKVYDIALDYNGLSNVFYGEQSLMKSVKTVEGGEFEVLLPAWIYTSESCVLGWSANPKADRYDFRVMTWNDSLYKATANSKKLYAVLGNAKQCVEMAEYDKVYVESEHGRVELEETFEEGDTSFVQLHKFAKDSTLLVPRYINGNNFRVHVYPDSGYVVDSVRIVRKDSVTDEFVKNHDVLCYYLYDLVIKPYFSEDSDSTKIPEGLKFAADTKLYQSGNGGRAIRLNIVTGKFEPDREAEIRIAVVDALGNVVLEDVLTDSVEIKETPFKASWNSFPKLLNEGKYTLRAEIRDRLDSMDRFEQNFEVAGRIEVAADRWQMVAVSAVDQDSIVWDDDPLFYWWNETTLSGDYWQYKKWTGKDRAEENRGYWYSSTEGRPLVLKSVDSIVDVQWTLDSVYSGWNLMSNPNGWAIRVPDSLEVCGWDNENGEIETDVVEPYGGVWVYARKSQRVSLDVTPVFTAAESDSLKAENAGKRSALAKAASADSWKLRVKLNDGRGHWDSWNVLGVGETYELPEPPGGPGQQVKLSVLEGKKRLAKSVVAPDAGETYQWNLELSAVEGGRGFLMLEGVRDLQAMGFSVKVTADGQTVNVSEGDSVKVLLKTAGTVATVTVSRGDKPAVAMNLTGLKVSALAGAVGVQFVASENLAGSQAAVDVVDLRGRLVASDRFKTRSGQNSTVLPLNQPGVYLLRVRAGGKQLAQKIALK